MSEPDALPQSLQLGLLLETVQAQQRLAEATLAQLGERVHSLDAEVRTEVARAARDALAGLNFEIEGAVAVLSKVRRAAELRWLAHSAAAALLSITVAVAAVRVLVPSRAQINVLRARRAEFAADVMRLRRYGGEVDLRRCGTQGRLCVRVWRSRPAYGAHGDFLLVKSP